MTIGNISTPLDGYKTWLGIASGAALGLYLLFTHEYQQSATVWLVVVQSAFLLHRVERIKKEQSRKTEAALEVACDTQATVAKIAQKVSK